MSTIWKTTLAPVDTQEIRVPAGAEMLCASEQHGNICIWYRCDPSEPTERRLIAVCGTGDPAPSPAEGRYIGTASLNSGDLIFHVFERIAPPQDKDGRDAG